MVSITPRPHFTPGKDPVPILQEVGLGPSPVWKGEKPRPHWDSMPDLLARSQSLYRLSYPACRTRHNSKEKIRETPISGLNFQSSRMRGPMEFLRAACLVTCKNSDTELITKVECKERIQATNWKIRTLNFTC